MFKLDSIYIESAELLSTESISKNTKYEMKIYVLTQNRNSDLLLFKQAI